MFVYQLRKKCSWLGIKFNFQSFENSGIMAFAVFSTNSKLVELETWVVHDLTKYSKIMCFITINMDSPLATASWNRPRSKVSLVLVQMSSSSVLAPKSKSISESWNNYSSRKSKELLRELQNVGIPVVRAGDPWPKTLRKRWRSYAPRIHPSLIDSGMIFAGTSSKYSNEAIFCDPLMHYFHK